MPAFPDEDFPDGCASDIDNRAVVPFEIKVVEALVRFVRQRFAIWITAHHLGQEFLTADARLLFRLDYVIESSDILPQLADDQE